MGRVPVIGYASAQVSRGTTAADGIAAAVTGVTEAARAYVPIATLLAASTLIANVAAPAGFIIQLYAGREYERHLLQLGHQLAADFHRLADSVGGINNTLHQQNFHQHVHNFLSHLYRPFLNSPPSAAPFLLVFHPGTDWHGGFYQQLPEHPHRAGFGGAFKDLTVLLAWALELRRLGAISPEREIWVALPSSHFYLSPNPIVADGIGPLRVIGQVHQSGRCYVSLPASSSIDGEPLTC